MLRTLAGAFTSVPTALILPFWTQTWPLVITCEPSKMRTLRMTNSALFGSPLGAGVCANRTILPRRENAEVLKADEMRDTMVLGLIEVAPLCRAFEISIERMQRAGKWGMSSFAGDNCHGIE